MDLRQLHAFIVIVEHGSISRAADVLDISQPTLSRQMQLLERELGQHLLRRTGRGVEPTEAGRRLFRHARAIHRLTTHARQDMLNFRSMPQGRVRLGIPPRIARRLTPHIVQRFRQLFPDSSINIAEGLSQQIRDDLIRKKIDLALLYDPPPSALLECESIFREDLVLAYRAANGAAAPKKIAVGQLSRYPLVLPSAPNTIRTLVEGVCREANVQLHVVAEVDVVQTIVETVSAAPEDVYTIIPRSAIKDIPGRHLGYSAIVEPRILNNLTLALPRDAPRSRLVKATAALIRDMGIGQYLV